jgi:hypothetical protein
MTINHIKMILRILATKAGTLPYFLSGDCMPVGKITMLKIKEVLRLILEAKVSHAQIAAALGISKGVATKYIGLAVIAGLDCHTRLR